MKSIELKKPMRYLVSKKGFFIYLRLIIFYNATVIILIILFSLLIKKEAISFIMIISISLTTLDIMFFHQIQILGSVISFDKDEVLCSFLKRKRRIIKFNEIKDYGVFWERGVKFIYISNFVLSQFEQEKIFGLYKKIRM